MAYLKKIPGMLTSLLDLYFKNLIEVIVLSYVIFLGAMVFNLTKLDIDAILKMPIFLLNLNIKREVL